VPAHGLRGSRSQREGREGLSPRKERREREKLSITMFRAGVGGWIFVVFLTARGFLAEFLVLLSKHIVSMFHNLQQYTATAKAGTGCSQALHLASHPHSQTLT